MKFFKKTNLKHCLITINTNKYIGHNNNPQKKINYFLDKFSLKKGKGLKSKINLGVITENIQYFIFFKNFFIKNNYPQINGILQNILEKKLNFNFVLSSIINLIKSPFIVKSISTPKKIKKKTKSKFFLKIIYSNENKRIKNSYKQLYYYSNSFLDNKFNIRLYKASMFSFLE